MNDSVRPLRDDALRIWRAGVDAVSPARLIPANVCVDGSTLWIADEPIDLERVGRIVVVGAGKAGGGMAAALEAALGQEWMTRKRLAGWVNVPADCVRPLERIQLHAARPPGANEPTAEGVAGAEAMLRLVELMSADDLCLCLISGGGSALMPAPVEGASLADKLAVTRHLSASGANIIQLNTVRKQLSRIKGGGLARACRAGRMISLIISDVPGDPIDVIASGPTAPDTSTPEEALAVLKKYRAAQAGIAPAVFEALRSRIAQPARDETRGDCQVRNLIIGNNATAVDAAGEEAKRLGYQPALYAAHAAEGPAEDVGRHLAEMALRMRGQDGPDCLISGGEPVVRLIDESRRGLGGRNQQLALAALERLAVTHAADLEGICLLSGGTDGEDGPTDAAGALVDRQIAKQAASLGLDPKDYLDRNDAYHFFAPLGGLIKTGPTDTNVCDVRVVVVRQRD